jgi:hypothetical protein
MIESDRFDHSTIGNVNISISSMKIEIILHETLSEPILGLCYKPSKPLTHSRIIIFVIIGNANSDGTRSDLWAVEAEFPRKHFPHPLLFTATDAIHVPREASSMHPHVRRTVASVAGARLDRSAQSGSTSRPLRGRRHGGDLGPSHRESGNRTLNQELVARR